MQQAELIITYLRGKLQGEQRQEFEQRLTTDPELRLAVKDYRTILEGFKGMRHETSREEISSWSLEDEQDDEELLVMAYLEGNMPTAARKNFEQAMAQDPKLKRKVESQRAILQGFKGLKHESFAQEVEQWAETLPGADQMSETKVVPLKRKTNSWRYAAAATVLILVVVAFWLLTPSGGSDFSYTAFRQESYIPPVDLTDRGSAQETLTAAARDFNQQNYTAAVEKLQIIGAEDSLYVSARFWMGHSYYQLGDYQRAVETFSLSLTPPTAKTYDLRNFSRDNASWTRILAQLARIDKNTGVPLKQELENYLTTFLENADQSDAYYAKGIALQQALSAEENEK